MGRHLSGSAVFLGIFFAMVWLPFGQTAFLADHWMKVGAYMAPILLFLAFKQRNRARGPALTDLSFMSMLFAAFYLLHQVEEHWVDFLGREYALYDQLNTMIAQGLGEDKYGIMTRTAIFYINSGAVWALAFTAIACAPRHVFPAAAMAGLMVVNGLSHVIVGIVSASYNSGLGTSVLLFLPFTLAFFVALRRESLAPFWLIGAAMAWGLFGHVLLFAGLFAATIYGLIPVATYYAALIAFGVLPVFLFRGRMKPA